MTCQTVYRIFCGAMALLAGGVTFAAASIEGSWEGKLQSGGTSLRIVFNVSSNADGSLKATMDSPDQSAFGIGVDSTSFKDNQLRCEIKRISGVFEGKLNEADRSIDGFWTQFGVPLHLVLTPKAIVEPKRPQTPTKPYPYLEEEVTFENKEASVKFAGTLTKPSKGKKFPAVLLISGSGPQNRDGEIMGHKPFLVLADDLTRRGIAVLRVDDRGVGGSTKAARPPTSEDLAQDALAAIAYLKSRRDIDKKRIGVVGASEGGLVAPMAAMQSKDVAFVVMLAGPGARGADVLAKQRDTMLAAQGVPESLRPLATRLPDRITQIAMQSKDEAEALAEFDKLWEEQRKQSAGPFVPTSNESDYMKAQQDAAREQLKVFTSPWMRFFLTYDPAPTLAKIRVPVLAINGSLDTQVVAAQNLPLIEAALKSGGNRDYTVKELPGLNHLLQKAKTGSPGEYRDIAETLNSEALTLIGEWISNHAGLKKQ